MIKKFENMSRKEVIWSCPDNIGELKKLIKDLPDDMGIVAYVNGGGSSTFSLGSYVTDKYYPGEELFVISVD